MTIEELKKIRKEVDEWIKQIEDQAPRHQSCVICGIIPQNEALILDELITLKEWKEGLKAQVEKLKCRAETKDASRSNSGPYVLGWETCQFDVLSLLHQQD